MVPLLLAAHLTLAVDGAPPGPESLKLLVLDMTALGGDPSVARAVDPVLLSAVAVDGVEVISQGEIRTIAALDAARSELGCETSSCLADLAGAMGAQLVLFGSVSQLGETTTLSLSLFDSENGKIVRDTLTVTDVGRLPVELPPRARALLSKATEPARGAPVTQHRAPTTNYILYYGGLGGVIVGGVALLAGAVVAGVNEVAVQDPTGAAGAKRNAQEAGVLGLVVAGAGAALAGVGAVLLVIE